MKVIAATVASDPTKYSEAFLGKSNQEYCAWILDSEKWGGLLRKLPVLMHLNLGYQTKCTIKSFSHNSLVISYTQLSSQTLIIHD